MNNSRQKSQGWDWMVIVIVAFMLITGMINIYSAAYNPNYPNLFSFNTFYGKQMLWIGLGLFLGIIISLIDSEFIRKLTPSAFIFVTLLLIIVLFTQPINGARSWLGIGPFGIQPSEFSKLSTSLMLAFVISQGSRRSISKNSFISSFAVVILTMLLVLIQNDTGTFLVFTAFFFVMYREGITLDPAILFFLNNVFGFRFKKTWIGIHFIPVLFVVVFFSTLILYFTEETYEFSFLPGYDVPGWVLLAVIISALMLFVYLIANYFSTQRFRKKINSVILLIYLVAMSFIGIVSYTYLQVFQVHQKDRIDLWLGKIEDKDGKDYNRNRALAAVGSGGLTGIGYKEAILSSPKSKHVPESETDFIFSVLSEEWGFMGSGTLVILFTLLLVRIIIIAERQKSRFARIYANSVAMILFYHFAINVGMNIGLIPVIGIPLPFYSYGGSAMMSFLIMIIILLKLDSQRKEVLA